MNDEKLVSSGVLDALAVKNQELAEVKRLEREKTRIANRKFRDKNIAMLYLCDRFPLAASEEGLPEIPEKELPLILKRAKRHYLKKLGIAVITTLPSIGASAASFGIAITKGVGTAPDSGGILYFFGGIIMSIFFAILSGLQISWVAEYIRILTRGKNKKT